MNFEFKPAGKGKTNIWNKSHDFIRLLSFELWEKLHT